MMDKLAALDGAVIQGGPITVRPNLSEREANGVDTRAAVLACLLAAPAGMTEWAIMKAVDLTTGGVASALESLTVECPALCEAPGRRGAILYLDREEWQRTGWYAGGVHREASRVDEGGYIPYWKPSGAFELKLRGHIRKVERARIHDIADARSMGVAPS